MGDQLLTRNSAICLSNQKANGAANATLEIRNQKLEILDISTHHHPYRNVSKRAQAGDA